MATVGDRPVLGATAIAELALLPALLVLIGAASLSRCQSQCRFVGVVSVLWLIDAAFLVAVQRGDVMLAAGASRLAIDLVLVLVVVIGGRIVPAFTGNALRRLGETPLPPSVTRPWVE